MHQTWPAPTIGQGARQANALPEPPPNATRPRGRPRGAQTCTLRRDTTLGMHHFAFLRSWYLGLGLRESWQRYLAFSERAADLRHIEHRRRRMLRQVLEAGHQLNLSLPPAQQITRLLALLGREPGSPAAAALPSLDEFVAAQGLDREFYAEAELLQIYREHHHLDSLAEGPLVAATWQAQGAESQVRALNQLETLLARRPQADDRVDLWLSPALCTRLRAAGLGTLGTLARAMRDQGPRWVAPVRGLGVTRAGRLAAWLAPLAQGFGQPTTAQQPLAGQRPAGGAVSTAADDPTFGLAMGIAPLAELVLPPRGAEEPGAARGEQAPASRPSQSSDPQTRGDLLALQTWLRQFSASQATHRAYAKEVERFYLWCLHVRRKPLAALDGADAQAYRDFLARLPPAWVQAQATPRSSPAWRPFRGPLSPGSQRYAARVVRACLDGLTTAGHLPANPMREGVPALAASAAPSPAARAFSEHEWAFVMAQAQALPVVTGSAGAGRRPRRPAQAVRLRLILSLLAQTGLCLRELAHATVADITSLGAPEDAAPTHRLQVRGRGRALRELPLSCDLMALIHQHHADAAAVGAMPCPAPLVCALGEVPRSNVAGRAGKHRPDAVPLAAARALGTSGLYLTLKRFFRRISRGAHWEDGLQPERLMAASTHWLRHTYGRQGAAGGVALAQLQQAMGHASQQTTRRYLRAAG